MLSISSKAGWSVPGIPPTVTVPMIETSIGIPLETSVIRRQRFGLCRVASGGERSAQHHRGPPVRGPGARRFPAAARLPDGADRLRALGPVVRRPASIFRGIEMRAGPTGHVSAQHAVNALGLNTRI